MKKNGNWTPEDKKFLMENLNKITIEEIADHLGRPVNAVNLYLYRNRIPVKSQVKKNLMYRLIEIKFGRAEYFQPTRDFFQLVNINQKRWASLYFGYSPATEEEIIRVAKHLNFSVEDTFQLMDARQLNIFEEQQ